MQFFSRVLAKIVVAAVVSLWRQTFTAAKLVALDTSFAEINDLSFATAYMLKDTCSVWPPMAGKDNSGSGPLGSL